MCIRANVNQSELIRKKFCISFVEKRLKINPTQFGASIRMNPKESEVNFQSESLRTLIHSNCKSIRIRIDSDSFGLKNLLRIRSDRKWIRLNPIQSETSIRMNPNESKVNFQSEWSRTESDSIRDFYPNESEWI